MQDHMCPGCVSICEKRICIAVLQVDLFWLFNIDKCLFVEFPSRKKWNLISLMLLRCFGNYFLQLVPFECSYQIYVF